MTSHSETTSPSSTRPVLLLLGAGSNVGLSIAQKFHSKNYKIAACARNPPPAFEQYTDLLLPADLADPGVVEGVFQKCEEALGIPSVVVYNGTALPFFSRS